MAISSSSSLSKALRALMMTLALCAVLQASVAAAARQPSQGASTTAATTTTTNLTLHNLCPYPVWPLVTANSGASSIPTDADGEPAGRLDSNGDGLATLFFPPGAWSGRVVARTGCPDDDDDDEEVVVPFGCATGDAPPVTVVQVSVGGPGGAAAYSVSLVDGFNVPVVVTPHGMPPVGAGRPRRRCPTLGCAVDLAAECPVAARAPGGGCGAGATQAALFKRLCPDTRTNATDVEVSPQDCVYPGEIKVVFCPKPDSVVSGHL